MTVKVVNRSGRELPAYATPLSAGVDLRAALEESVVLAPLGRALIPTGLFMAKHGVTVLNTPGTIDADYRGEIKVILVNLSEVPFTVEPGERIAQMVFARCEQAQFEQVETLDETQRGAGGFGSTGLK